MFEVFDNGQINNKDFCSHSHYGKYFKVNGKIWQYAQFTTGAQRFEEGLMGRIYFSITDLLEDKAEANNGQ